MDKKKTERGGFWMFTEELRPDTEQNTESTESQENTKPDSYNFFPDQPV